MYGNSRIKTLRGYVYAPSKMETERRNQLAKKIAALLEENAAGVNELDTIFSRVMDFLNVTVKADDVIE